jgi:hypothetical protein
LRKARICFKLSFDTKHVVLEVIQSTFLTYLLLTGQN